MNVSGIVCPQSDMLPERQSRRKTAGKQPGKVDMSHPDKQLPSASQRGKGKLKGPKPQQLMAFIKAEFLKQKNEMQETIREAVTTLKGALKEMEKRLEAQGSQIQQIEEAISDHSDRVVALEAEVGLLEDLCKTLKYHIYQ